MLSTQKLTLLCNCLQRKEKPISKSKPLSHTISINSKSNNKSFVSYDYILRKLSIPYVVQLSKTTLWQIYTFLWFKLFSICTGILVLQLNSKPRRFSLLGIASQPSQQPILWTNGSLRGERPSQTPSDTISRSQLVPTLTYNF